MFTVFDADIKVTWIIHKKLILEAFLVMNKHEVEIFFLA